MCRNGGNVGGSGLAEFRLWPRQALSDLAAIAGNAFPAALVALGLSLPLAARLDEVYGETVSEPLELIS